jgi:hypothetical protein
VKNHEKRKEDWEVCRPPTNRGMFCWLLEDRFCSLLPSFCGSPLAFPTLLYNLNGTKGLKLSKLNKIKIIEFPNDLAPRLLRKMRWCSNDEKEDDWTAPRLSMVD